MVIAGDVYDGDWKDFNTGLFFIKEIGRLKRADIPVRLLYGNHDADSEMTKSLALPDNVHVFSSRQKATPSRSCLESGLAWTKLQTGRHHRKVIAQLPRTITAGSNMACHRALEGNNAHARMPLRDCRLRTQRATSTGHWAMCTSTGC